MQLYTVHQCNH